jgi:hypothetical protein
MLPKAPNGAAVRVAVALIAFTAAGAITSWLVAKPARDMQPLPKRPSLRAGSELRAEPSAGVAPSFDVAVVSDLNQGYGSKHYGKAVHDAVRALTERLKPDLVLITGDMVAGQKRGVDAPAMWRGFHAAVTVPLEQAGIPMAPTPGNHDASPTFTEERAEYVRQWGSRSSALSFVDASSYPLRYSFTFRGAFFLSLDAAAVGPLSSDQRAWAEGQLRQAADYQVKIAFGHLPLHPIAHGREREILNDAGLEAIFAKHGVDLYVSGHQHAYYPGTAGSMRHVSMPCLGAGARRLLGTQRATAQALVLLHVESDELSSVDAFAAPDFTTKIARSTLPPRIAFGRHLLVRDDLSQSSVALRVP